MSESEPINVRVEFKGDMVERFEKVKKHLGLEANTEVLRTLVNDKYLEITEQEASKP